MNKQYVCIEDFPIVSDWWETYMEKELLKQAGYTL